MAEIAALAAIAGTVVSSVGTIAAGHATNEEAKFQAKQDERSAAEERAIASRKNEEQSQKTAMVLSEQKAKAASSGAGVVNPTVLDIMGETEQYGDYLARSETAAGENKARGFLDKAAAARYKGKTAFRGAILEGIGTGLKGAAKAYG